MKYIVLIMLLCNIIQAKINIYTTIEPIKVMIEMITGNLADVNTLVNGNSDPHTFTPKPRQMFDISKSDVYFSTGFKEVEDVWLSKIKKQNVNFNVIDITKNINYINSVCGHGHIHNKDPHIWTSLNESKTLLFNIYEELVKLDTPNRIIYKQNLTKALDYINTLDIQIKQNLKNKRYMSYHPSFSYFNRDYNLSEIVIEKDAKEPKPKEIIELIKQAQKDTNNIQVIIVNKNYIPKSVKLISNKLNAKVVNISSLINWPNNLLKLSLVVGEN
ncbi:MAG: Unknown protein [uncultured Campylobacterales bacterium]|uniref:Zinc ABC transporter, periplasmic-binding protein ZnuA n=1 Tax=uncultured Campylobacterales bacterium TaxID=352960 RepID=A0A6S6SNG5_9BACT|nr:MAG: Unknown protein [uncultured Campylobacterales bacterium]